jgi:hypothetical protein
VALLGLGDTSAVEAFLRLGRTSEADATALKALGTLDGQDTLAERLGHDGHGGSIPAGHESKTLARAVDVLLQKLEKITSRINGNERP